MAGRPTTYTVEMGRRICDAIACSQSGLRKTLEDDPELPAFGTVEGWLRKHAQFHGEFAEAKRRQIELMAEDIVDISRDDTLDPADKRIRVDTLKWLLSKLIPKTYGDKIDVTSGGEPMAMSPALVDQRVQSIVMLAAERKRALATLDDNALKLLD